MDASTSSATFLGWFKAGGGSIHPSVGLTTFPSMGRGAVALQNIKKDTILFTLPRSLTLSTRTSSLLAKFGEQEWRKYQLHKGWVGLILCMLWEDAAGEDGKWNSYLNSLPDSFQTPMFWDDDDLRELQGTTIFDKIGKAEAEKDYYEKLLPAVKSHTALFPTASIESHYSLHKYHVMGSRILSRSFRVERWAARGEESEGDQITDAIHHDNSDGMEVDAVEHEHAEGDEQSGLEGDQGSGDEDGDEEDPADVAMVPLADMLNARYHSENAKLCYDSEDLQMICTHDIQAGDQIWNTYGDPPNSNLLRRYGHVDLVPMAEGILGNPADIVEIRADVVLDALHIQTGSKQENFLLERIDWWLEAGGDDVFMLEMTSTLPEELISFVRLLAMPKDEWEKTQIRGKAPKPKADMNILRVAETVLQKRLGLYKTTLEEDEALLKNLDELGRNKYLAIVVRLGEKRILTSVLGEIARKMVGESNAATGKKRRRDSEDRPAKSSKKAR